MFSGGLSIPPGAGDATADGFFGHGISAHLQNARRHR